MEYRRSRATGGTFFFTVNLNDRSATLLVDHIDSLRAAIGQVKARPDHLHAVWHLPEDDGDYPLRWGLIKAAFSRQLPPLETVQLSRRLKRERGVWQRRYWEHQIHDEQDLQRHLEYIHFNPVKHGHARSAVEWPYSSIHRYVRAGVLPADWAGLADEEWAVGER